MSGLGAVQHHAQPSHSQQVEFDPAFEMPVELIFGVTQDAPGLDHAIQNLFVSVDLLYKLMGKEKITSQSSQAPILRKILEQHDTQFGEIMKKYDIVHLTLNNGEVSQALEYYQSNVTLSNLIPGLTALFQRIKIQFLIDNAERVEKIEKIGNNINQLFTQLGGASTSMSATNSMIGTQLFTATSFVLPNASMSDSFQLPSGDDASMSSIDAIPGEESSVAVKQTPVQQELTTRMKTLIDRVQTTNANSPVPTARNSLPHPSITVTPALPAPIFSSRSPSPALSAPVKSPQKDLSFSVLLTDLEALEQELGQAPEVPTASHAATSSPPAAGESIAFFPDETGSFIAAGVFKTPGPSPLDNPLDRSSDSFEFETPVRSSTPPASPSSQRGAGSIFTTPAATSSSRGPYPTPSGSSSSSSTVTCFIEELQKHYKACLSSLNQLGKGVVSLASSSNSETPKKLSKKELKKLRSAAKKDYARGIRTAFEKIPREIRSELYRNFLIKHNKDDDTGNAENQKWVRENYFKYEQFPTLSAVLIDYQESRL